MEVVSQQFSNKRKSGREIYIYYSSLLSTDIYLAEEEHNDLLIIFPIPMGMKFIPLEEH